MSPAAKMTMGNMNSIKAAPFQAVTLCLLYWKPPQITRAGRPCPTGRKKGRRFRGSPWLFPLREDIDIHGAAANLAALLNGVVAQVRKDIPAMAAPPVSPATP